MMHVLGVMGSGAAMRIEGVQHAIESGDLPGVKIGAAVCNVPDVPFVDAARSYGLPTYVVNEGSTDKIDQAALEIFLKHGVELVILGGYRRKIGRILLDAYLDRILNIHPGPLPRFGGQGMMGIAVQEAVLEAGVSYAGPVVHVVDEEYDHGPILGYWPIKVRPDDTSESLQQRCVEAGNRLYVREIRDFLYRMDHPELY